MKVLGPVIISESNNSDKKKKSSSPKVSIDEEARKKLTMHAATYMFSREAISFC